MELVTVGIIGVNGKYGGWLKRFFEKRAVPVIGSDIRTELSNRDVVQAAQVIIFAVPISQTVSVIEELVDFARDDQLWMDVTSLKEAPIKAMLKSQADVVGLHPMAAPSAGELKGQTLVVCAKRLRGWGEWLSEFLRETGAIIKISEPEKHDRVMAIIQVLCHASGIIRSSVIRELGMDIEESLSFTSPFYRLDFSLVGRLLRQDPGLYADIQIENPHTIEILWLLEQEARRLRTLVELRARDEFIKLFSENSKHYGEKNLERAYAFFDHMICLVADMASPKTVVIETIEDRPGILADIASLFKDAGINLSAIHSQKRDGVCRFFIAFENGGIKEVKELLQKNPNVEKVI